MNKQVDMVKSLKARMNDLLERTEIIEDDLRHPLEADSSEQAIDLADDESLEGVDDVLHAEIVQIRNALARIENGTYGICAKCGEEIREERLAARPIATDCITCASEG